MWPVIAVNLVKFIILSFGKVSKKYATHVLRNLISSVHVH